MAEEEKKRTAIAVVVVAALAAWGRRRVLGRSSPIVALSVSVLLLAVSAAPAGAPRLPIPGHWAGVIRDDHGHIFPIKFVVSDNRRNVDDFEFRLQIKREPPGCGSFGLTWEINKEKRLRDGRFRYHREVSSGTEFLIVGEVKDAPKRKAKGTIRASSRFSGCADTLEWTAFHVTR